MLWSWIAEETIKQNRVVSKEEAFYHFGWDLQTKCRCWCCQYVEGAGGLVNCAKCPIVWGGVTNFCGISSSPYMQWRLCSIRKDAQGAAEASRVIANLPEKKEV